MSIDRFFIVLLLSGFGLALPRTVAAEEPTGHISRVSAADLATTIKQLGSSRAVERHAAEQSLLASGPGILDQLPLESSIDDPAARDALRRIRLELERLAADAAAQPSRVTLDGELPLPDLVREIQRQTGNRVELRIDSTAVSRPPRHVRWTNVRFWEAIDEVCRDQALSVRLARDPRRVVLSPATESDPRPRSIDVRLTSPAPLRMQVVEATEFGSAANPASRLVRLRMQVWAEPRIRPLFLSVRDRELQVQIAGREAAPYNPLAERDVEFDDSGAAACDVMYVVPGESPLDALALQGQLELELIGLTREFRWENWRTGPRHRHGDVSVALEAVQVDAERRTAQIGFTISFGTDGPAFESHRTAALLPSAAIELSDGRRITSEPHPELTRELDGSLGARYRFIGLSADEQSAALVLGVPANLTRTTVRFRADKSTQ